MNNKLINFNFCTSLLKTHPMNDKSSRNSAFINFSSQNEGGGVGYVRYGEQISQL